MQKNILLIILISLQLWGKKQTFECVTVIDGDTMYALNNSGDTVKIRLWGVDCPERGQPYGDSATLFVKRCCDYATIQIDSIDTDPYGRIVAKVFYVVSQESDNSFASLSDTLLYHGLAWWSNRYAPNEKQYEHLENSARVAKRGLWAFKRAKTPWVWRKMSKRERQRQRKRFRR